MPYKVHKLPNGKYKAYRQAEGGRPARPLSNHPQSAETAKKQIEAIHANEGPENHSAGDCVGSGGMTGGSMSGGTYSLSSGSQPGMWKLTRKKKLESYAAPPNKSELISKLKLGERQKKKLDMMADVSNEARDPSGKWTSGGNAGGSAGGAPAAPRAAAPAPAAPRAAAPAPAAPRAAAPAPAAPSSLGSSLPKVSSGISPEKKAQIAAGRQQSQSLPSGGTSSPSYAGINQKTAIHHLDPKEKAAFSKWASKELNVPESDLPKMYAGGHKDDFKDDYATWKEENQGNAASSVPQGAPSPQGAPPKQAAAPAPQSYDPNKTVVPSSPQSSQSSPKLRSIGSAQPQEKKNSGNINQAYGWKA